ncbi:MAG: DUF2203 domain-containing protein [Verrucomicrobia bacterium]|jgi:hypothetical protein|nr:DUF2203 domain-containing protein [Verrucomicrobiota bacterium]
MNPPRQFTIHYTRENARLLLPLIKQWLTQMLRLEKGLQAAFQKVELLVSTGQDHGGPVVESYLSQRADFLQLLGEFQKRQILLKDLHRGLIDFPAVIDGREVFLCWEQGEDDIEFWHELDGGYAGRERL